ncbi:MAG: hypothetical protein R2750_07900 [Bacteroidales bacterium]
MKNYPVYLILSFFFSSPLMCAEKPPIKFGEISIEIFTLEDYHYDTTAAAIVICDYGFFEEKQFQFTRVVRIKILNNKGFNWANQTFRIKDKTMVRGYTYNMVNDEIEKTKLKSESIFKERITDFEYQLRVAMPNVRVGSVIDIEYTFPGIPWEWYFQSTIPVIRSELKFESSPYISFRKTLYGFEPLYENSDSRWVAKDMPAFKEEPYINSLENYLTKIVFDIYSITFPGYFYESFTKNWEDVSESLLDNGYFGVPLRNSSYLNGLAKSIKERNIQDKEELLKTTYAEIKVFKWNKNERIQTTLNSIAPVFKTKTGNSAEINIAFIQLLEKLDFNVVPVMMSTRSNGILSPINPSLNNLNYVIAKVVIDDKTFLLDATEEFATHDILPIRCLNWFGYEVNRKESQQVELQPNKKDFEVTSAELKLDRDLNLIGTIKCQKKDYAALNFRNYYHSFNSTNEYIDDFTAKNTGISILSSTVENFDDIYAPIKETYEVSVSTNIEQIKNDVYLYPMIIDRSTQNPFKLEERKYPIDYGYKLDKTYIINISLDEDFTVTAVPEEIIMTLPDNSANFSYQVSVFNNKICFVYKIKINKIVFSEAEYKDLKELFNQIISKHNEPVILKLN